MFTKDTHLTHTYITSHILWNNEEFPTKVVHHISSRMLLIWYASALKANLTYLLVWKVGLFPGALSNHCAFLGWIHHKKKHLFKNPFSKHFFSLHIVQFPWTYVDYLLLIFYHLFLNCFHAVKMFGVEVWHHQCTGREYVNKHERL